MPPCLEEYQVVLLWSHLDKQVVTDSLWMDCASNTRVCSTATWPNALFYFVARCITFILHVVCYMGTFNLVEHWPSSLALDTYGILQTGKITPKLRDLKQPWGVPGSYANLSSCCHVSSPCYVVPGQLFVGSYSERGLGLGVSKTNQAKRQCSWLFSCNPIEGYSS